VTENHKQSILDLLVRNWGGGLLMGRNDKQNATIKDQGMLPPEILDFSLKCGEKQK